MRAFVQAPLRLAPKPRASKPYTRRRKWTSQQTEDLPGPRFTRGEDEFPQKNFFDTPAPPKTPNERALQSVRETMTKLGADAPAPQPRPFTPVDVTRVNPVSALAGAVAAGCMSYAAWAALGAIITFFVTHPLDGDIYVVQRLGAVARTCLVCLFALGSGISGVTSLGLGGLFVRTLYGKLSGEFEE